MSALEAVPAPSRPVLRWHGGKWMLAPWVIAHLPPHQAYVEPFGGAASVLLRKPVSYAEVYNDLDDELVTMFRVLREPAQARQLISALELTPFSRTEFDAAYEVTDDPVEMSRRLIVRSFQGFGSDGTNPNCKTGFRSNSNRSGSTPAHDWANYPHALRKVVARFRQVVVENRPALQVIADHDRETTVFYVDPPYMPDTRSQKNARGGRYHVYRHELTDDDHLELLRALNAVKGMVVLSGYHSALYDEHLEGWARVERAALADGARARIEVLWLNRAAAAKVKRQGDMFGC